MGVERRVFLGLALCGTAGWGLSEWLGGSADDSRPLPATVLLAGFDSSGRMIGVVKTPTIRKTNAEWKKALAVDQFMVTRRGDTELAYAGEYWNFHGDGLYRCVCCGTALFDSKEKFNSGTGWPSFTEPIAKENVAESPDTSFGVGRTEVSCRRCGA
ncbi:MAG: peptide-methionine (R)-S-oxide reductase MsrB, partial [Acidobacteriota bacterium]